MPRKKLTRVEILAVKAAVIAGLRMRLHMVAGVGYTYPLYGREYMRGYWTAIQMITSQLPEARKTVRLCRIYERCARSIKSYAPRA